MERLRIFAWFTASQPEVFAFAKSCCTAMLYCPPPSQAVLPRAGRGGPLGRSRPAAVCTVPGGRWPAAAAGCLAGFAGPTPSGWRSPPVISETGQLGFRLGSHARAARGRAAVAAAAARTARAGADAASFDGRRHDGRGAAARHDGRHDAASRHGHDGGGTARHDAHGGARHDDGAAAGASGDGDGGETATAGYVPKAILEVVRRDSSRELILAVIIIPAEKCRRIQRKYKYSRMDIGSHAAIQWHLLSCNKKLSESKPEIPSLLSSLECLPPPFSSGRPHIALQLDQHLVPPDSRRRSRVVVPSSRSRGAELCL